MSEHPRADIEAPPAGWLIGGVLTSAGKQGHRPEYLRIFGGGAHLRIRLGDQKLLCFLDPLLRAHPVHRELCSQALVSDPTSRRADQKLFSCIKCALTFELQDRTARTAVRNGGCGRQSRPPQDEPKKGQHVIKSYPHFTGDF